MPSASARQSGFFALLVFCLVILNIDHGQASDSYCSFKSSCDGVAQGGQYCNRGQANCENSCGGNWCSPPPSSEYYCNFNKCDGTPQGGTYCNKNYNACTRDCGGTWCEDTGSSEPEESGCYMMYKGWIYKAKSGSKFYERYGNLHDCLTKCDSDDIVVLDKEGRCQCWKEGTGEWVNIDKRMSFVGDPDCTGKPWDAPLVGYDEACLVTQYPGYSYKPVNGGDWFAKHNMLHKCFNQCEDGQDLAIDGEDGFCYCWNPDEGELKDTDNDLSTDTTYIVECGHGGGGGTKKKFSGWVGEICHTGYRLDRFDCDDDEDCEEVCAKECDMDPSCDSFVIDDDRCELYEGCDIIRSDGCDDCSVHVCLEDCPSSTSSWFGSHGYLECTASRLAKRSVEHCEKGRECNPIEECAELCEDDSDCTTFMLDDDAEDCELFESCDAEYDDDWDAHFIGHIRDRYSPDGPPGPTPPSPNGDDPEPSGCYLMYEEYSYKPSGGSSFYRKYDTQEECFDSCNAYDTIYVVNSDSGKCYCWYKGDGRWQETEGSDVSYIGDPDCTGSQAYAPSNSDDDLCTLEAHEGWAYKPVNGGKWYKKYEGLHRCLDECDDEDDVITSNTDSSNCYCWERRDGRFEEEDDEKTYTRKCED